MIPSDEELKEAVEHLKFRLSFREISDTALDKRNDDVDKTLLSLAEHHLSCGVEWPKKMPEDTARNLDSEYSEGFNEARFVCLSIHTKLMAEKEREIEELKSREKEDGNGK